MIFALKSATITPWPKFKYFYGKGYRILEPEIKMPPCPDCHEDKLTFVMEKSIVCMSCHKWFSR